MKKYLFTALCSIAIACGVGAAEAPQQRDPYFETAIKHVDVGGELLFYQNTERLTKTFNRVISSLGKITGQDDPTIQAGFDVTAKLLDLASFKAQTGSSVKLDRRLYACKQFVLVDPNTKSVLSGKAFPNTQLDNIMRSLPADTRIAVYTNVNTAYIWARINEEIIASGNTTLIAALARVRDEAQKKGVNIDALAASASGPMMLVVSGKTPVSLKIAIAIADKDNVLSARLRKSFPPKAGESTYPIRNLDIFPNAQLVYSEGCVLLASDPSILQKPEKMFGEIPRHAKYIAQLPKTGSGFVVVDIPPKFAEFINSMTPAEYRQVFRARSFSLVSVGTGYPEGMGSVTVSSFSVTMIYPHLMNTMLANAAKQIADKKAAAAPAPAAAPAAAPAPANTAK